MTIEQDELGWYMPENCDIAHAFRFKDGKFQFEFYRNDWIIDVHISKGYLTEFLKIRPTIHKEQKHKICCCCGQTAVYGITFQDGYVKMIHNTCYNQVQRAMDELQNECSNKLLLEIL